MKTPSIQIGDPEIKTQKRLIDLFDSEALGYTYLGDFHDQENRNIKPEILLAWLARQGVRASLAEVAVEKLKQAAWQAAKNLTLTNEAVYGIIRDGQPAQDAKSNGKTETVRFIDWEHPEENDFAVAEEVTVRGGEYDKRPDLVIYVNGIALAVVELKRSSVSVAEGILQNIGNQAADYIRGFFTTIQFCVAGNDTEGLRYGTVETPAQNYLAWKNDSEKENAKAPVDDDSKRILGLCATLTNRLDWDFVSFFDKRRFLDLVHNFVTFDKGVKKVCRPNQFFGIKAAQLKHDRREGGIIWHTQGSGKTLTMIWLAKWILENKPKSRVLIVTDREELDDQIEDRFLGVKEKIVRTKSCADLIAILNGHKDRLICSLIMKFGKHDGEASSIDWKHYIEELLSSLPPGFKAKDDVTVFIDECHRTQSGKLHAAMKAVIPDGVYIGFTGTPLLKTDKSRLTSKKVFGGFIHVYKYDEAVKDDVVVDLCYEARTVPQKLSNKTAVDEWFDSLAKTLSETARAKLKQAWATMRELYSSEDRKRKIVTDIIHDFGSKLRLADGEGNALLVTESIRDAFIYWRLFQRSGFTKCAAITSYTPDPHGGAQDPEEKEKLDIYRKMLNGADPGAFEENAKDLFVHKPGQMQLLIVVDKLLTGFDAPPCTYLYLDKKLKDHTLFQAICRVNRKDTPSKKFGYIVDYRDLFNELKNAVTDYTTGPLGGFSPDDIKGLIKNRLEYAKLQLTKSLDKLEEICEAVPDPRGEEEYGRTFCGNGKQTKEDEIVLMQQRSGLYALVRMFTNAYIELKPDFILKTTGFSDAEIAHFDERVKFYANLSQTIALRSGDLIDTSIYNPKMRELMDRYVDASFSQKIGAFDSFTILDYIEAEQKRASGKGGNSKKETKGEQHSAAEIIENNIRKAIHEKNAVNPRYYAKMSEILDGLIKQYEQETINYQLFLEGCKQLVRDIKNPEKSTVYPESIRNSSLGRAFYDLYDKDEAKALKVAEAAMSGYQADFRGDSEKELKIKRALYGVLKDTNAVEEAFILVKSQKDLT